MIIAKTDSGWQLTWRDHSLAFSSCANVTSWKTGPTEHIYTSPIRLANKRIRGGIPVCFPWFGGAPRAELPPHGLLQDCSFELIKVEEGSDLVEICLATELPRQNGIDASIAAELSLRLSGDDELSLTLTVKNTDDSPMEYQAGFHPYFYLQDAEGLEVTDDQVRFKFEQEVVDERCQFPQMPVQIKQQTQNVTLLAEEVAEMGIWKVSDKLCQQIQDLPDGDQDKFVCVNPIFNTVTLQPFGVASHSITIKV